MGFSHFIKTVKHVVVLFTCLVKKVFLVTDTWQNSLESRILLDHLLIRARGKEDNNFILLRYFCSVSVTYVITVAETITNSVRG